MFYNAVNFNSNISGWDVSNVTDMRNMFQNAYIFNQNLSSWNVSRVVNMDTMFGFATEFRATGLKNWYPVACTNMNGMFWGTSSSYDVLNTANSRFIEDISAWPNKTAIRINFFKAVSRTVDAQFITTTTDPFSPFYGL
jgi:surface protein